MLMVEERHPNGGIIMYLGRADRRNGTFRARMNRS
jgi:hypothetical protein